MSSPEDALSGKTETIKGVTFIYPTGYKGRSLLKLVDTDKSQMSDAENAVFNTFNAKYIEANSESLGPNMYAGKFLQVKSHGVKFIFKYPDDYEGRSINDILKLDTKDKTDEESDFASFYAEYLKSIENAYTFKTYDPTQNIDKEFIVTKDNYAYYRSKDDANVPDSHDSWSVIGKNYYDSRNAPKTTSSTYSETATEAENIPEPSSPAKKKKEKDKEIPKKKEVPKRVTAEQKRKPSKKSKPVHDVDVKDALLYLGGRLKVSASGSTCEQIAEDFPTWMDKLVSAPYIAVFLMITLSAAFGKRKNIEEDIKAIDKITPVIDLIDEEFLLNEDYNFTKFNLTGSLLIRYNTFPKMDSVASYRSRIGANDLWEIGPATAINYKQERAKLLREAKLKWPLSKITDESLESILDIPENVYNLMVAATEEADPGF